MKGTTSFQKLVCVKLGTDFKTCTKVQSATVDASALKPQEVLIKVAYCGLNASDVNFINGKYIPGVQPPFDTGFEAVGTIVAVGSKATSTVGTNVVWTKFGSFSEYVVINEKLLFPIPQIRPEYLSLVVSGLTASIALEEVGNLSKLNSKKTVLVTAAAGGTGIIAVQLIKAKGCHVIAVVGNDEKVKVLKDLGADRVINYKKEKLEVVLKKEYPSGLDLVYESVGGEMYETCLQNLATFGKLIVIGMVSGYQQGNVFQNKSLVQGNERKMTAENLGMLLIRKNATVAGFFLSLFSHKFAEHWRKLVQLAESGKLRQLVDETSAQKFVKLEQIPEAVDYMYQGNNIGKVVINLSGIKASTEKAKL